MLEQSSRGQVLLDIYGSARRLSPDTPGVPLAVARALPPLATQGLLRLALLVPASREPVSSAAVGRWRGVMEEGEAGRREVELSVTSPGASRLAATLTALPGAATPAIPVRELSHQKGRLEFTADMGNRALRFSGLLRASTFEGTIHPANARTGPPLGVFTLRFVK